MVIIVYVVMRGGVDNVEKMIIALAMLTAVAMVVILVMS